MRYIARMYSACYHDLEGILCVYMYVCGCGLARLASFSHRDIYGVDC